MTKRWGKWGPADQRGALNFIDGQAVLRGIRTVRRGRTYALGIPFRRSAPFVGGASRNRNLHLMSVDGGDYDEHAQNGALCSADDYILLSTHGTTHVDALCHVWSDGQLYNGYNARTVRSSGARQLGAQEMGPIVTRGVLLDVAGLVGVSHLPGGFVIEPSHVDEAMQRQSIESIEPGDAVIFRTGWVGHYEEMSQAVFEGHRPGIGRAIADWLIEKEVSLVGADTPSVEVVPSETGTPMPLHLELLRNQGLPLVELLNVEAIAKDEVWMFLFSCTPLPVVGGTAGPVAPVAVA